MSRLQAELSTCKQHIVELEAEVKRLQSDNDMLVMKLAESAAAQADVAVQKATQAQPQQQLDVQAKQKTPVRQPNSKRVHYRQPNYGNNGYGTWH